MAEWKAIVVEGGEPSYHCCIGANLRISVLCNPDDGRWQMYVFGAATGATFNNLEAAQYYAEILAHHALCEALGVLGWTVVTHKPEAVELVGVQKKMVR